MYTCSETRNQCSHFFSSESERIMWSTSSSFLRDRLSSEEELAGPSQPASTRLHGRAWCWATSTLWERPSFRGSRREFLTQMQARARRNFVKWGKHGFLGFSFENEEYAPHPTYIRANFYPFFKYFTISNMPI